MPIVDGWFTDDTDAPSLIGSVCPVCGTYVFPPRDGDCPSPTCESPTLERTPISRRGTVWSYTENRYTPPAPFVPVTTPFEPYALAAVSLEREGLVVLGRVVRGVLAADLRVGMEMQLEIDDAHADGDQQYVVYAWAPATPSGDAAAPAQDGAVS